MAIFDTMDEISENCPAARPSVVLTQLKMWIFWMRSFLCQVVIVIRKRAMKHTSSIVQILGPESNSSNIKSATDSTRESKQCRRKRKRSKVESFEEVMSKVMKTVTDELKETDKMFLELEKKKNGK